MNTELKYIGFYNHTTSKHQRVSVLSATNKMDYICDVINEIGYNIHIVSPSWYNSKHKKPLITKQKTFKIDTKKKLTITPSFSSKTKWLRNIKIVFSLSWLFFWLIFKVKRNEKIIVYHAPWISLPVILAKKIKGFYLILEVEEIYADISILHPYFKKLEEQIINIADSYIFPTELLANKIGSNKKYVIIYGNYKIEQQFTSPPNDNKIHILYAGSIDEYKSGAYNAVNTAKFLGKEYIVHIIGFGNTKKLIELINLVNNQTECKIVYDGIKKGKDYIEYCQSCHIGLVTRSLDADFLETSFPSKTLSYLRMGLQVISGNIKVLKKSKISSLIQFYNEDNPKAIAEAIKKININKQRNNNIILRKLHNNFMNEIKTLIINK